MTILRFPIEQTKRRTVPTVLWNRQLDHYPPTGRRVGYLGIVVLTTISLYYLYYVEGAVTPLMLPSLHMSFLYFLFLLVVSNAIGAFSAFIGGLSDKIGRANLTVYGTLVVGIIQLTAIPRPSSTSQASSCRPTSVLVWWPRKTRSWASCLNGTSYRPSQKAVVPLPLTSSTWRAPPSFGAMPTLEWLRSPPR